MSNYVMVTYKLVVLLPCPRALIGESLTDVVPFGLPVPDIICQLKKSRQNSPLSPFCDITYVIT